MLTELFAPKSEESYVSTDYDQEMMNTFSGRFTPGKIFGINILRVASDTEIAPLSPSEPELAEVIPITHIPSERVLGGVAATNTVLAEIKTDGVDELNVTIPRRLDTKDSDLAQAA
jgi:hypothetical protein